MGKVSRVKNRIRPVIYLGAVVLLLCVIVLAFFAVKKYHRSVQARANGTVPESILATAAGTVEVSDPELEPVSANKANISPEIKKKLEEAEETEIKTEDKSTTVSVDLIVFAGQSNMAGWGGDVSKAPALTEGAGGEFRSVSDPSKLYTITEPFGFYENTPTMNDMFIKRGTLVTAFVNAYYEETGVPVVAVSASKGGTPSTYWATEAVGEDVKTRFLNAKTWLKENGYEVRNQFLVFLQGENDVIENVSTEQYLSDINVFSNKMFYCGIDKFLMIRIGATNTDPDAYKRILDVQTELCRTDPRFVLVSTLFSNFGADHMTDTYHYDQDALNAVGTDAGKNAAYFAINRQDPQIMDYRTGELFEPIVYEGL